MEIVITEIKGSKERQVADLWWDGSFKTHVRKIQCCQSSMVGIARDTKPITVGGCARPVCCQNALRIISYMGFQGKKSILIS